jgi:hypothetical protein
MLNPRKTKTDQSNLWWVSPVATARLGDRDYYVSRIVAPRLGIRIMCLEVNITSPIKNYKGF